MGSSKKKAAPKAKEPIKLRFKKLANGNKSIHLAYWNGDKWEYEFLKNLYIVPDDKQANDKTLQLARAIQAQRIVEMQKATHGFSISGDKRSSVNIIDYVNSIAKKKGKKSTASGYNTLAKCLEKYSGLKTTFKQVDKQYCMGFIEFLKTAKNRRTGETLKQNAKAGYFRRFVAVINAAVADDIITGNPLDKIKPENKPKMQDNEIVYLTIEEVKKLENTPSKLPCGRQAFLFSCYTGLRYSDIKSLTWGDIRRDNNGKTSISYRVQKTGKQEYLPIPQKAVEFLPERSDAKDTDNVFDLPSSTHLNVQIKIWAALAGITKPITYHSSRHTFATILLNQGASMAAISKLLAHADLHTTQKHYAAIQDEFQRTTVDLFDKLDDGLTE